MSDFENLSLERKDTHASMILSVIAALFITAALLFGYIYLRKRHAAEVQSAQQAQVQPAQPAPQIEVLENEALLKGSQAILSGTVKNISQRPLTDLSLEVELKRRAGGEPQMQTVAISPDDLAPNEQGEYTLAIDSHGFSGAKILKLKSGSQSEEIAFKRLPGAPRPPERIQHNANIIVVKPSPRRGEEFINTPDNPSRIP